MSKILFRVKKEDKQLIKEYVSINNLDLSAFIREAVLEKIENDLQLDEARILKSLEEATNEKTYNHEKVWETLEVD